MAAASNVKSATLSRKNLHEYLKTLPSTVLDKLYLNPTTCLAIFRDLPEIAKHYVIRILFIEQPVPQAVIASWVAQPYSKEHLESVAVLKGLKIWYEAGIPGGLDAWTLNPTFKKNVKVAVIGGGNAWSIRANLTADSKAKDIDYLDKYAMERWECVLHYMVGSQQQEGISADAVRILHHAGLMKRDEDGSPTITKDGFQFLLLDTTSQVWYFMLQYLDTVEARGLDLVQCLNFLFQLSFSILGKDYSTEGMNEGLLTFLQHLREFGLVYQRKRKGGKFYPTRLAINMVCGKNSAPSERKNGFLVVETNYRIYAYTNSNLQIALLGLFAELMYRFPNLCVAVLTRDSIRMALKSGITAEQIINFLRSHVHPKVLASNSPLLPATIVDQIVLWEKERQRFSFVDGVTYSQFLSQSDFNTLRDYAIEINCLIWQNEKKRTMVISKDGQDEVKRFWKRVYKGAGQS